MIADFEPALLEKTVLKVSNRVATLSFYSRLPTLTESRLWYELVACILGSRVTFELAQNSARCLYKNGLLKLDYPKNKVIDLEHGIADTLMQQKYIFYRLKANHIARTFQSIYAAGSSIKEILKTSINSFDARERLIISSVGIGPKQSSLFLRNIGYAENLAILDTHVLKYMHLSGITSADSRKISDLANYQKVEGALRQYASNLSVSLPILDTAIWVVMRIYSKEFSQ